MPQHLILIFCYYAMVVWTISNRFMTLLMSLIFCRENGTLDQCLLGHIFFFYLSKKSTFDWGFSNFFQIEINVTSMMTIVVALTIITDSALNTVKIWLPTNAHSMGNLVQWVPPQRVCGYNRPIIVEGDVLHCNVVMTCGAFWWWKGGAAVRFDGVTCWLMFELTHE